MLWRQIEFKDLTVCLGSFHLLKIYLGSIGKYLRGSGTASIWMENEIFGPKRPRPSWEVLLCLISRGHDSPFRGYRETPMVCIL